MEFASTDIKSTHIDEPFFQVYFCWLIYNYTTFAFKLRVVIWFQGPFSLGKHEAGVTKIPLPSELSGGVDRRYIKNP